MDKRMINEYKQIFEISKMFKEEIHKNLKHDDPLNIVIESIHNNMYRFYESIFILVKEQKFFAATILTRCFLEEFFNLHYIINNKQGNEERYDKHYLAKRYLDYLDIKYYIDYKKNSDGEYFPFKNQEELQLILDHFNVFLTSYEINPKNWHKKTIDWSGDTGSEKVKKIIFSDGEDIKYLYNQTYAYLCNITHGNSQLVRFNESEVHFKDIPLTLYRDLYLRHSVSEIAKVLKIDATLKKIV
jgi:hypothetical protein